MSQINITIGQPQMPKTPMGMPGYGMPGMGMPSFAPGMPGIPGSGTINIGHGGEGKCCGKGKEKKKDKGILGDILTSIFGDDSFVGRLVNGRGKKCKCKKGHGSHDRGGSININLNSNQRSLNLGF